VYFAKVENAMTEHDKNKLLVEILGDDELNQLRQSSLLRGLREMRRRRQRTVAARMSMMALPVMLLAWAVFYPRVLPPRQEVAPIAMSAPSEAVSKVEFINKEQLFALFPNRPMALVGKPGHQQVIFLDDHRTDGRQ
jgi:hypothetical protein